MTPPVTRTPFAGWYQRAIPIGRGVGHSHAVETVPISETLPVLYRAVLDAIGELESLGFRREAAQVRIDAIRAYSGAWTPAAARRLEVLRARAGRSVEGRRHRRPAVLESLDQVDLRRTPV